MKKRKINKKIDGVNCIILHEAWYEWATKREKQYMDKYKELGTVQAVADELGVGRQRVQDGIKRAKKRAIKHGWSPDHDMTHTTPEGYFVKGVSTYYDADGKVKGQWVKTKKEDEDRVNAILNAMGGMLDDFKGQSINIPAPPNVMQHLMTVYPIADPHIGMYAWCQESGDDYDLDIATSLLLGAMQRLVDSAPYTETCLIDCVGDFFHSDNDSNMTMRSGNKLDVDTRWALVMRVGVFIFKEFVNMALKKHKKVKIIVDIGNHDDYTSAMLILVLEAYFENNPRVTIDTSPAKFHYHKFGKCLIGSTHGDTVKPVVLNQVMATDMPKVWGETTHRYFYTGHVHHKRVFELPGCIVESFNTLAAKDFYTASHGYRSKRNMTYIVLDKEHGEVERHTVDIGQIDMSVVKSVKKGEIKAQRALDIT
jgi:hypothetical protein